MKFGKDKVYIIFTVVLFLALVGMACFGMYKQAKETPVAEIPARLDVEDVVVEEPPAVEEENIVEQPVVEEVEEVYYEPEEYYVEEIYYEESEDGVLTRSGGVNYYNGRKETWYSQKVLPGGGLDIPGRHVAEDGTIRDAEGYVCVAASDLPKGSVVDTSLGAGKVYDTGCASGTTDIYTNW